MKRTLAPNLIAWSVLLVVLWWLFPRRVADVRPIGALPQGVIALPWFGDRALGTHCFEARLLRPVRTLKVWADDCVERLEVDGQACFATEPRAGLHCAYSELPLPAGLSAREHRLRFTVRNLQGEAWFDIKEAHGLTWARVVALWVLGVGAFVFAGRCGYPSWVGWPLALGCLLALQYLEITTPWVRQHDVGGHREYIDHLASCRALPGVQQGWETWQPPLYYVTAALWRWPFSGLSLEDPFRPVQYLAGALYLATLAFAVPIFRRLSLDGLEAAGALAVLALLPGLLFFAGRINNDVLLPVLSAGLLWGVAEYVHTGARRQLACLAALLLALLATKGSSLAVAGGALLLVLWAEWCRSGWQPALRRAYLVGLPAALWQLGWCWRTAVQTGNPLYVNASLPEDLRVGVSPWARLFSFDFAAYLGGGFYYDQPMRHSYPTALVTSLLYGEYGMRQYPFQMSELLRWGCLGALLLLLAGALIVPRPPLRAVWLTALVLAACQTGITTTYAVQYPFACNQNMRFFAQAFVPFGCLFGLGVSHFWRAKAWTGRAVVLVILAVFLLGLTDYYRAVLF